MTWGDDCNDGSCKFLDAVAVDSPVAMLSSSRVEVGVMVWGIDDADASPIPICCCRSLL